jgi:hypothetical protein
MGSRDGIHGLAAADRIGAMGEIQIGATRVARTGVAWIWGRPRQAGGWRTCESSWLLAGIGVEKMVSGDRETYVLARVCDLRGR